MTDRHRSAITGELVTAKLGVALARDEIRQENKR